MTSSPPPAKGKRPILVTWLGLAVFLLSGANFFAAASTLMRREVIDTLNLNVPLNLLIGFHLLSGVIWLVIGSGWWWMKDWARLALPFAFLIYEITIISQQLIFARQAYARGRLPFAAATALIGLGVIVFLITRPRVKQAFASKTHRLEP